MASRLEAVTGKEFLHQTVCDHIHEVDFFLNERALHELHDVIIKLLDDSLMTPFGILEYLIANHRKTTTLEMLESHLKVLLTGIGHRPIAAEPFIQTMLTHEPNMSCTIAKKWFTLFGGAENAFEQIYERVLFKG